MNYTIKIYKNPRLDSEVVGEISDSTEIVIDESESNNFFYKVCTVFGVEGFCLKRLITDKY